MMTKTYRRICRILDRLKPYTHTVKTAENKFYFRSEEINVFYSIPQTCDA